MGEAAVEPPAPPAGVAPPVARRRPAAVSLYLILVLFPLAFFVRLLFLHGRATAAYLTPGMARGKEVILRSYVIHTGDFLAGGASQWVILSAILLVWPFLCPHWERLFSGSSRVRPGARYFVYLIAAAITAAVAGVGFLLRWP